MPRLFAKNLVQNLRVASCALVVFQLLSPLTYSALPSQYKQPTAPEGMVLVPAGEFSMGGPDHQAVKAKLAKHFPQTNVDPADGSDGKKQLRQRVQRANQ